MMNTWMRTVCCACSTLLATGIGTIEMGCAGSYTLHAQITPFGGFIDITFTTLDESDQYDFDGENYVIIIRDGKPYHFYPSSGRIIDPETGQVYQLDDPSWQRLLEALRNQHQHELHQSAFTTANEVHRQTYGLFTPNLKAGMGFLDEFVSIEISLEGDTPLPLFDEERWPTLQRALFVFPDGVEGSPDPMRLELNGEPSDVFGYMAALGVTDGTAVVDHRTWSIIIDENEWADVFIDDALFTSIPLH